MRGTGATGHKLIAGGPTKPNKESMGKVEADKVLKVCRKVCKKFTDGLALQKRKGDDNTFEESTFTGVLVDKIRLMSQVEKSPMKVDHTYPNKELVLIRIAEEANLSGCMISICRSFSQRVIATGARDGHTFCIKVVYANVHSWKVVTCVTHPEPVPVTKTDDKSDEEDDLKDDNKILGEEGNDIS